MSGVVYPLERVVELARNSIAGPTGIDPFTVTVWDQKLT
jgi:hypothetical protein